VTEGETAKARLIAACELLELGGEMMAATLRRRHPDASPEQIENMLDAWLLVRDDGRAVRAARHRAAWAVYVVAAELTKVWFYRARPRGEAVPGFTNHLRGAGVGAS
jgi:hypothetical protein